MKQKLTLTQAERDLLFRYRNFYISLASGKRRPRTAEQAHFVEVCRGKAQPVTQHEVAYIKWRKLSQHHVRERESARAKSGSQSRSNLGRTRRAPPSGEAGSLSPKELEIQEKYSPKWKRYVHEPWGSRDDWKRDQGQNWRASRTWDKD